MRARTVLLSLAAAGVLLALAACGGGGRPDASTPTPFVAEGTPYQGGCNFIGLNQPKRMLWPSIYLGKPAGALVRFHEGEPVPISFQVENCGTEPVRVTYRNSQRYDFVITDSKGNEVWRWSSDKLFAQSVGEEVYQSGVAYREEWDQRSNAGDQAPPGIYKLTGLDVGCWDGESRDCDIEASVKVEITP